MSWYVMNRWRALVRQIILWTEDDSKHLLSELLKGTLYLNTQNLKKQLLFFFSILEYLDNFKYNFAQINFDFYSGVLLSLTNLFLNSKLLCNVRPLLIYLIEEGWKITELLVDLVYFHLCIKILICICFNHICLKMYVK